MSDHEIMTLEEVARYLRVSDRTVYDWANKGDIPGGKIGTSWRFKRVDIKQWLDEKLSSPKKPVTAKPLTVRSVLAPERVLQLSCQTKDAALDALIDAIVEAPEVENPDELRYQLYQRESLMSTAIGSGVGVPHVRLASVRAPVMAVGINDKALPDYMALDETPVRIICMIAAHNDQHAEYLRLLAAISTRLSDGEVRKALLASKTPKSIHAILTA